MLLGIRFHKKRQALIIFYLIHIGSYPNRGVVLYFNHFEFTVFYVPGRILTALRE